MYSIVCTYTCMYLFDILACYMNSVHIARPPGHRLERSVIYYVPNT